MEYLGSSLKAHQYLSPIEPVNVTNLAMALRLNRMGYPLEYITDFVTGPWSPMPPSPDDMERFCPELFLPSR